MSRVDRAELLDADALTAIGSGGKHGLPPACSSTSARIRLAAELEAHPQAARMPRPPANTTPVRTAGTPVNNPYLPGVSPGRPSERMEDANPNPVRTLLVLLPLW